MFDCKKHSWSHITTACPACTTYLGSTSSAGGTFPMSVEATVTQLHWQVESLRKENLDLKERINKYWKECDRFESENEKLRELLKMNTRNRVDGPYIGKGSEFLNKLFKNMDVVAWTKPNDRHYAYQYALWAYEQGVREAIDKLRKTKCKAEFGMDDDCICFHSNSQAADWLEKTMLGDE